MRNKCVVSGTQTPYTLITEDQRVYYNTSTFQKRGPTLATKLVPGLQPTVTPWVHGNPNGPTTTYPCCAAVPKAKAVTQLLLVTRNIFFGNDKARLAPIRNSDCFHVAVHEIMFSDTTSVCDSTVFVLIFQVFKTELRCYLLSIRCQSDPLEARNTIERWWDWVAGHFRCRSFSMGVLLLRHNRVKKIGNLH